MDGGSSCEIIYESCFKKLNPTIKATKVDLKTPLVGFSGKRSWSVGEVLLEITIGDAPSQEQKLLTSLLNEEGQKIPSTSKERVLSCFNTEEKVIVNDKYPDQTVTIGKQLPDHFKKELQNLLKSNADVFAWTHADMIGILRTIMVEGKPFNTEHKLNEYNHIKPIKKNKRGLGPDSNMAACKETKELTKAGILWKAKRQTWVANPVMEKETPTNFLVEIPPEDKEKKEKPKEVPDSSSKWRLYTDGASNSDGSGAGLMLIDPEGKESTGSPEMEIAKVAIFLDSQLLVNQIKGTFTAKQASIKDYLQKVKNALRGFEYYTVEHVHWNQNKKADALRKLASITFEHLTKEVLVEVLTKRLIEEKEVLEVETQERKSWMDPIHEYLLSGLLPEDTREARKIRILAPQYKLI
ncbi:reverse transcriptase domain-containing protein [Tanacetum coccineum]